MAVVVSSAFRTSLSTIRTETIAMGDRFLSSAGAGGNCARPTRLPDPSPVLDKIYAPMGPKNFIQYWGWGLEKGSSGISRLQFCTG